MKAINTEQSPRSGWVDSAVRSAPGTWAYLLMLSCLSCIPLEAANAPLKPADLFVTSKVWNIHLQFTAEQWEAMEPQASGGWGMRGPGGDRFRGPGGPGGPGGPVGFGPGNFLAPAFLKGDKDHDGKLNQEEFRSLGDQWFSQWDGKKNGQLDIEQLRAGMNTTLAPAQGDEAGKGAGRIRPPGPPLQGAEGHRNGLASASGIDFQYVHADLDFEGQTIKDVGVRYKGNGTFMESRGSTKRSLKIELNRYVKGQKLAGETKLNLHNNVTDASWMNEVLSYRLFRDAGVPAPRTSYAKVYVTVPGKYDNSYLGLYSIVEDVDSHFANANFQTKEGTILKPVTTELFGYLGEDWSKYEQAYDPKTELGINDKRRVIDFAKLVTTASDEDFSSKLGEYLNMEEFARFMSVTVWLSTLDSILMMGQNFYVYLHPQTHQFQFIPWDLDHSFGQFPMGGTQEQRENLSIQTPWRGNNRFLERLFKNETFKKVYLNVMTQLSKTVFVPERFNKQVDELAATIRPAVSEESPEKLKLFDKVVAGEPVERFGFGNGPGRDAQHGGQGARRGHFGPGGFGQPAKPIKGFVTARARSVTDQLAGKAEGETLSEGGFGGPPRFGGGREGFGPGMFLAPSIMDSFDINKDGKITREEFLGGFAKWFAAWDADHTGHLTEAQIREGINHDVVPFKDGPPPGFGPPPGGPNEEP